MTRADGGVLEALRIDDDITRTLLARCRRAADPATEGALRELARRMFPWRPSFLRDGDPVDFLTARGIRAEFLRELRRAYGLPLRPPP